jgi:4-carboxymuconolactone decarboxylase
MELEPGGRVADRQEDILAAYEDWLRRLAINDEAFTERVLGLRLSRAPDSPLDAKTHALVQLAALVALDAAPATYQWNVEAAFAAGASPDEIVGVAIAIASVIGLTRVVSAAPELALSLGYDINRALETVSPPATP